MSGVLGAVAHAHCWTQRSESTESGKPEITEVSRGTMSLQKAEP